MRPLNIEDEYAKIAEAQGLISLAEENDNKPSKDELDSIQLLYGVKPNGKEYDRNIMEKAHPETLVISPAHDAMNGVLENNNQRQDMMAYIALKHPNGNFVRQRYVAAYSELVKSVVKAGFKLDNSNDVELMKLADSCATRLEKQSFAFLPAAALYWGAAGIATLVGAIAAINHTDDSRQNVIANAQRCIKELTDLTGKMPVEHIIQSLNGLVDDALGFNAIKLDVFTPKSVVEAAKNNKEDIKAAQEYRQKLNHMAVAIPQYIEELQTIQPNESAEWDWLQKLKDIARSIVPDDVADSVNALNGLNKAVQEEIRAANLVMARAREQVTDMAEKETIPAREVPKPVQEAEPTVQQQQAPDLSSNEKEQINKDYESLIHQITNS